MRRSVLIYFSPTHTTKHIVEAVNKGISIENSIVVDLTLKPSEFIAKKDDIIIIGIPVYSSRIPLIAKERLQYIHGNNTPVICLATYGNNKFGDSLKELSYLMELNGFVTIAAGAYIGEHSFSSISHPIAINRPNGLDLSIATKFGYEISNKLYVPFTSIFKSIPGDIPTTDPKQLPYMITEKTDTCNNCGTCIEVCPVHAINDHLECDGSLCIKCYACIKSCATNSRILQNNQINDIINKLEKIEPKVPVNFL
jgi:ferredoxin/flavodoxin